MEQNPEQNDIFAELRQIRQEKQISLEAIAKDSRIQLRYLEAIEHGEFEKIPEVYDKLFFQTYLSYLQLEDPQRFLDAFRRHRKALFHPTPTTTLQKILIREEHSHPIFNLKTLFFGGPIIILIALIAFFIWNSRTVEGEQKLVRELPVREIAEELDKQANPPVAEKQQSTKVNVEIVAVDTTWLRYIVDRSDTTEFTLWTGNKRAVEADSVISFLVGNAAGIQFNVNGDSLGALGKRGEIITYLKVDRSGVAELRKKTSAARPKKAPADSVNAQSDTTSAITD